jgi:hypothetical protein
MSSDPIVVPLRSRRRQRALLLQKLQHVAPGAALLFQGLSTLASDPHGFELTLAIIEIVTSALLIVSFLRTLRAVSRPATQAVHTHGVDWVDICVAGVLAAEALERWHVKHHIARPTILLVVVMLVLGLFHGRIGGRSERRRSLRAGDDELYIGGRPFRTFRAKWSDIAAIDVAERWATIRMRDGRVRRLDLSDLENAAAVRHVLEVARTRVLPAS